MAKVSNLAIALQSGSDNTHYATWEFNDTINNVSSVVKAGDLVSIKAGATYYNGVKIPSWVMNQQWYVSQLKGDRAVLGKNASGSNNICSPINVAYLTGGSGTSSSTITGTLEHYKVQWHYHTGQGPWFSGGESTTTEKISTYSPPENAIKIKVTVTPVSKTPNNTPYWSGEAVSKEYAVEVNPPDKPSAPTVQIEKFTLTASIENISDYKTDVIQFEVLNGNDIISGGNGTNIVTVLTQRAIFTCPVEAGGKYRVRCRAGNIYNTSTEWSAWSDYSKEETTIPAAVTNPTCKADSKSSVQVSWDASSTATGYTIEYATRKDYFDSSSQVSSINVTNTVAFVTSLETGREWFFRIRATNSKGESSWSNIISTIIGTKPEPPTTWSLTSSAIVGEEITLYWVHNSEDGSKQKEAEIQLEINGDISTIVVPPIATEEDEKEPTYSYTFNPSEYNEGADILWKVRTKGITNEYSDWSTQRTINLYAPPTLSVVLSTVDDMLETLPLKVKCTAGPITQTAISYYIVIMANSTYESEDPTGNPIIVTAGAEIYSKIINTPERTLDLELSGGDFTLKSGQSYTVKAIVSMNSGLTAEQSVQFTVNWEDYDFYPDAAITIDEDTLSAYIVPYCLDDERNLVEGITLSVYRREFNGTFTLIGSDLPNNRVTSVTDPHPALDYARYRVVVRHESTGSVSYEDIPAQYIGEPSLVIQWDEKWSEFDYSIEYEPETRPWTGSMVRLPYNVDTSEKQNPDAALVEYIGRKHPVSYYGTQRGEGGNWSTVIEKKDKKTLYALRRLREWNGDVYVREPSGTGYWARILVNISSKHNDLTIPVSFDITRVEGGI